MEGMADFNNGGQNNRWMSLGPTTGQSWSGWSTMWQDSCFSFLGIRRCAHFPPETAANFCDPGEYSYTSLAANGPDYSLAPLGPTASQPLVPRREEEQQIQHDHYMYDMMMDSMVSGATFPGPAPTVAATAPSLVISQLTHQAQATQGLPVPGQQMLDTALPAPRGFSGVDSMAPFASGASGASTGGASSSSSSSLYGNSNPVISFPGPTDSHQSGRVSVQGS